MLKPLIAGLLVGALAQAQAENTGINNDADINNNDAPINHAFYFGLGNTGIDSSVSAQEFVKDSATSIRLAWEGRKGKHFVFGAGISGLLYSDNAGFSQRVEDNFGAVSTAGSDAEGAGIYGEIGYRYALNEVTHLAIFGGYESLFSSSRAIANCSDCRSEDIDIEAGAYFTPALGFAWDNGAFLRLFYSQYLSGDLESTIGLNIGFAQ